MNAAVILIVGIVILALGYVFYGGWLSKQWGIDPSRPTPAHELEDGMDYCPAKAPVLMGHHGRRPDQRPDPGRCFRLGPGAAVGSHRRHLLRWCA